MDFADSTHAYERGSFLSRRVARDPGAANIRLIMEPADNVFILVMEDLEGLTARARSVIGMSRAQSTRRRANHCAAACSMVEQRPASGHAVGAVRRTAVEDAVPHAGGYPQGLAAVPGIVWGFAAAGVVELGERIILHLEGILAAFVKAREPSSISITGPTTCSLTT